MTDDQFKRLEEMYAQLITLIGDVKKEQHEMKKQINVVGIQVNELKNYFAGINESIEYLLSESAKHDKDIFILKRKHG